MYNRSLKRGGKGSLLLFLLLYQNHLICPELFLKKFHANPGFIFICHFYLARGMEDASRKISFYLKKNLALFILFDNLNVSDGKAAFDTH